MKFFVTTFADVYARALAGEDMTRDQLADLIRNTTAPAKEKLPLLKLGHFGPARTTAGSLRHDANLLMVSGIEGDYDGVGDMMITEITARLDAEGLAYIVYTTPSHTPATPRCRVLLPFAREAPPAARARMLGRLNGVLGGILAAESWSLSQAFYYGGVTGRHPAEVYVGDGEETIDERDDLDATAQGYRPASGAAGTRAGKGGRPDYAKLSDFELIDLIKDGEHYYGPASELARRWAYQGIPTANAEANLTSAFDAVADAKQDRKWSRGKSDIGRWVKEAYARVAKKRGTFWRALVAYVQEDPQWRGAIRFNLFTQQIEVSDPFPPQPGQMMTAYRSLRDPVDILEAMMVVQENGFPKANKDTVTGAVVLVAERNAYHPVREWFRGLKWDGEKRVKRLFLTYFPGELPPEDDPQARKQVTNYYENVGACFLVGAVARPMIPGCKLDCLPCLISPQGFLKSNGLQALVPDPAWFTDDLSSNIADRDAKESMTGKLIIELSEFPHIRKDIDRVKAFFSRQTDRYRRAYGRLNTDHPRQCVFIATANELEFIDVTGNRRVWPIPLADPVDIAAIERDREQLWAEAVALFNNGFQWWLPPEIEKIAGNMQDAYVEDDIWDERIIKFIKSRRAGCNGEPQQFTLKAVLEYLGFSVTDPGVPSFAKKSDEMRAARRLRRLGYRPNPHRSRGTARECFWIPVKKPTP